jgi:ubiquinone/menaquinone biosynthesis C-methylase UbiE
MKTAADPDNWENHWQRHADCSSRSPIVRYRHQIVVRMLAQEGKGNGRGMRILDLGSGLGDLTCAIKNAVPQADLLGFELSTAGVEISRRKVPGATFQAADLCRPAESLSPYEGWATHAVCSDVLEHVDDPVAFLRNCKKYLAPNASLMITVPGGKMSAFDRHIGHRQHFSRETIRPVLEAAGFFVEKIYLAGFPFFNLYRLAVIARGERAIEDAEGVSQGFSRWFVFALMHMFNILFKLNVLNCPLGLQVVAVARNK